MHVAGGLADLSYMRRAILPKRPEMLNVHILIGSYERCTFYGWSKVESVILLCSRATFLIVLLLEEKII